MTETTTIIITELSTDHREAMRQAAKHLREARKALSPVSKLIAFAAELQQIEDLAGDFKEYAGCKAVAGPQR